MNYSREIFVKQISKEELLDKYLNKDMFEDACKLCPSYGKVWSCPEKQPDLAETFAEQNSVYVIAIKINYSEELRRQATTPEKAQEIRDKSYEIEKRNLLLALLEIEKYFEKGRCAGAGKCILCKRCALEDGKPCRYPAMTRFSFTRFGLDCTAMLKDLFDISLQWSNENLPEYDVAKAALFVRQ